MSWSSGKDSTLALHEARADGKVEMTGLLTTVNSTAGRVAMHAVRRERLEAKPHRSAFPCTSSSCPGRAPTRSTNSGCPRPSP
jgi:diphthamide synthase (EF-2-diphthine--ammonia ligase)